MDAYVYGVIRASAVERSPGEGIDDQAVEVVTYDGLAALVSDAPNVPVKASRRNLMAHSRVLQSVIATTGVLPMRFGVVMPSREAVEGELLEANSQLLSEHLDVLEPYVELDVRGLSAERELMQSVVAERPDIARLRASIHGRPVESTYHERIRLGEMVAHAVAEKREDIAQYILAELESHAAAARPSDPVHDEMVANVAFLVERERVAEFDVAVDALGSTLTDPEVRVRYLGPLPPHNFVDLASDMEARAWA
jgi:hypothetical protein